MQLDVDALRGKVEVVEALKDQPAGVAWGKSAGEDLILGANGKSCLSVARPAAGKEQDLPIVEGDGRVAEVGDEDLVAEVGVATVGEVAATRKRVRQRSLMARAVARMAPQAAMANVRRGGGVSKRGQAQDPDGTADLSF